MLNPINFLILDEPTNHLDMQAKDVLKKSLASYDGTLIIVSHDREFLSGLASVTYEFKGGKVKQHLGGIEYFLDQKKMQNMRQVELGIKEKSDSKEKKKKPFGIQGISLKKLNENSRVHKIKRKVPKKFMKIYKMN